MAEGKGDMKQTLAVLWALLVFLWLPLGTLAAGDAPVRVTVSQQDVEESLGTKWYGCYMLDKKVGFARWSLDCSPDRNRPGYIASTRMDVTGLRFSGVTSEETLEFGPKPAFALRGAKCTKTEGTSIVKTELVRTSHGFDAVQIANGTTTRKPLGPLDYSLTEMLMPRGWLRCGAKAGDQLTIQTFSFDKLQLKPERYKLLAIKTSLVDGIKATYYEVEANSDGETILSRYDDKGRFISGKIGDVLELRSEPEEQAKNVKPVKLFLVKTVAIDKPLGEAGRVSGLVIEVAAKEGAVFKSGPRQTVTAAGPDRFVIQLGAAYGGPVQADAAEQAAHLAESDAYPINNPRVRALATVAIGGAGTPRRKVDKLVHFVSNYLTADEEVRPNRLLELLDVRRGACTEYAQLFTALARAAGIPARQVSGLAYEGDGTQTFRGHAWNEVVLDGQWVPVDPAWNETDLDATHIRLFPSKPDGEGELSALSILSSTFGKVSFKLIKLERASGSLPWLSVALWGSLLLVGAGVVLVGWKRVRAGKRHERFV
jgi:transglutaminase-like putative cysteine protease